MANKLPGGADALVQAHTLRTVFWGKPTRDPWLHVPEQQKGDFHIPLKQAEF